MGNPFSTPCDPCVNKISQWLDEKLGYTHNLDDLEKTMEVLKAKRDDLSRRVTRAEDRGLQRLAEVQEWITRVETIENRVNDILSAINVERQRLFFVGFALRVYYRATVMGKVFS
ncbi:putative disease resistance protein [Cardamine amara subsp. amara]|uniref:Disease resistance protein n=1 Tax=Cardamine amara subsp. amara TaxID=228776 RepID=A0ABD1B764_CARAN